MEQKRHKKHENDQLRLLICMKVRRVPQILFQILQPLSPKQLCILYKVHLFLLDEIQFHYGHQNLMTFFYSKNVGVVKSASSLNILNEMNNEISFKKFPTKERKEDR